MPAVEAKAQLGGLQDKLTDFLQDSQDLGFPSEADGVKRLCGDISLNDIEAGVGRAGTRKAFWVDDRSSNDLTGCGKQRPYKGWLTATECLRYLKQPVRLNRVYPHVIRSFADIVLFQRYHFEKQPDAERRLM